MENKNADVTFILKVVVESLVALTAEEDLLLGDKKFKSFKNKTWAVASPIDSLVKNPSGKIRHVLRLNVAFANPRSIPSDGHFFNLKKRTKSRLTSESSSHH